MFLHFIWRINAQSVTKSLHPQKFLNLCHPDVHPDWLISNPMIIDVCCITHQRKYRNIHHHRPWEKSPVQPCSLKLSREVHSLLVLIAEQWHRNSMWPGPGSVRGWSSCQALFFLIPCKLLISIMVWECQGGVGFRNKLAETDDVVRYSQECLTY